MATTAPQLQPHDLEAEAAMLGAILLDADAFPVAQDLLDSGHFRRAAHQTIFRAMGRLHAKGEPIDPLTLAAELEARPELEAIGGRAALGELLQSVATAANTRFHCTIVREKAALRQLIHLANHL